MLVDIVKIQQWLDSFKGTQNDLAKVLGCSRTTANYKMNGKSNFTLPDVKKIAQASGKKITFFLL